MAALLTAPHPAELTDDGFAAVFGTHRGSGMSGRDTDLLWKLGSPFDDRDEYTAVLERYTFAMRRDPEVRPRAIAALNEGAPVHAARYGWEATAYAECILRDSIEAAGIDAAGRAWPRISALLDDLLAEHATSTHRTRLPAQLGAQIRLTVLPACKAQAERGELTVAWLDDRCDEALHAAVCKTVANMLISRRDNLAALHNIPRPSPAACRAAVAVWMDDTSGQPAAGALGVLRGA